MSDRDCHNRHDSPNGPGGQRPEQGPNMPDLYQWTGEGPGPQGGPGQGQMQGGPDLYGYDGGPGNSGGPQGRPTGPDLYQYDGQGAPSDRQAPGGEDPAIANWHPDYSYSSPNAQAWLAANKQTRDQALDVNPDGTYTVKFGDCLSTIAQRALQDSGDAKPTWTEIKSEMNTIIKANDQTYSSLDYNKDYLKTGWKLTIPGEHQRPTQDPSQQDVPPHERCLPRPESNRPDFPCPPGYRARPSVIINNYYVSGDVYVNQGGGQSGPGQFQPQHRFCPPGANQPESYYGGRQGYDSSMQYQWQPQQGYAGRSYYDQGSDQGASYPPGYIQPIPNAVPGEGRAMMIPNAVPGEGQVQLLNYDGQDPNARTYNAD
ncbi:MAG TPA: LysM peptidoglycan-binding domain-containing protein, partial [Chroococcales cyanobacterium]